MDIKTILIITGAFIGLVLILMLFKKPKYAQKSNWLGNLALVGGLIFAAFQLLNKKDPLKKASDNAVKEEIKNREEKIKELQGKKEIIGGVLKRAKDNTAKIHKDIEELEKEKEGLKQKITPKRTLSEAAKKLKNL